MKCIPEAQKRGLARLDRWPLNPSAKIPTFNVLLQAELLHWVWKNHAKMLLWINSRLYIYAATNTQGNQIYMCTRVPDSLKAWTMWVGKLFSRYQLKLVRIWTPNFQCTSTMINAFSNKFLMRLDGAESQRLSLCHSMSLWPVFIKLLATVVLEHVCFIVYKYLWKPII